MENVIGVLLDSLQFPDFALNPANYQSAFWVDFEFGNLFNEIIIFKS